MMPGLNVVALKEALDAADDLIGPGEGASERLGAILALDVVTEALHLLGAGRPVALYRLRTALAQLHTEGQTADMLRAPRRSGRARDSLAVENLKAVSAAAVSILVDRGILTKGDALDWATNIFALMPPGTRRAVQSRSPVGEISARTVARWANRYSNAGEAPGLGLDTYRLITSKYQGADASMLPGALAAAILSLADKIPSNPAS